MSKKQLMILFMLGLILFLAACSAPEVADEPIEEAAETTETTEVEANVEAVEDAPAVESEDEDSGEETAVIETRTVEHAMGTTEVPLDPARVVVLDTGELDSVLTLGVKPVGAVSAFADGQYPEYLGDLTDGIENVGTIGEPNLEAILALQPDLILSSKVRHEALYDELSAIAPTVFAETVGVVWKDNLKLNAEALNKTAEADALFAAYEARLAELQTVIGAEAPSISMVRFLPGQVRIYQKASFIGTILEDAGLPRPEAQDADDFAIFLEDKEGIPQMDGEVLFYTTYGEQAETPYDSFVNDPLWQQIEAVQNEQAYPVSDSYWMLGIGMTAANLVLDDLFTYLADSAVADEEMSEDEAAADAFPVTIEHKYGSTTITERPERIVTVGLTDQDALLALGIVPVGTTEWFGGHPGSIWPWAQDKVGDAAYPETVGEGVPNLESVLALEPDLILALYSGIDEDTYNLLSEIAPTVAQPAEYIDYGIPWDELTLTVGQAVGQSAEAEALVAQVHDQFAQIREEYPQFVGATAVVAAPYDGVWVYGPDDARGRLLSALGFEFPEALIEEIGLSEFGGTISDERVDLLNVDAIIWISIGEEEIEQLGGDLYKSLPVHTEKREVIMDSFGDDLGGATSFISVLSLPFLLDNITPELADALDTSD